MCDCFIYNIYRYKDIGIYLYKLICNENVKFIELLIEIQNEACKFYKVKFTFLRFLF